MTTGVFNSPTRARQLIRFDGMDMGNRCFTDFDAVLEWADRAWLLFEVKQMGKGVPLGQRLALERFVNDASACGKYAVAAVVEHCVVNPYEDVYLRDCLVRSIYATYEYRWRPPKRWMTAYGLQRSFVDLVNKNTYGGGSQGPLFYEG